MQHKLKLAALSLVLAGAFTSAQAATVQLNGSSFPYNLGADPTDGNAYVVSHDAGSFTDVYTFSLSQVGDAVASAVGLFLPGINGKPVSYITDASITLFRDVNGDGAAGADNVQVATVAYGSGNGTLAVNDVAAGSYYFQLGGKAVGTHGGIYQFAVNTETAPVPEPETYALMLSGLGLLGFVGRRRMKKQGDVGNTLNFA